MIRRFLRWLFPNPFVRLLARARAHGAVTMSEVGIGDGRMGWYVSIRPPGVHGVHSHRYAWTGQSEDLTSAVGDAVKEADDAPKMAIIEGGRFAPRLGGKEFDE